MVKNPAHRFSGLKNQLPSRAEVVIIGSGMGSLTAAALLVKEGRKVLVLERNYLPGGCASSYKRKDYIFESGATTLVGLDEGMPLHKVLQQTGIQFDYVKLETPMKVIMADGTTVTRFPEIEAWISEAERVFGKQGQREFWQTCYNISKRVWSASSRHLYFPPSKPSDLLKLAFNTRPGDLSLIPFFYKSLVHLLKKHKLLKNKKFIEFIDEQLLITAQNKHSDVDALFGATALCYTLFGNYYSPGGLIEMAGAFTDYIAERGGSVLLRNEVLEIANDQNGFLVKTQGGNIMADVVLSGIPLNNLAELVQGNHPAKQKMALRGSKQLYSAFQAGIVFEPETSRDCLHYQIQVENVPGLPECKSFFLSLNHPDDLSRCESGKSVASVSLHIPNPSETRIDKQQILEFILKKLEQNGLITRSKVLYTHASGPDEWLSWTGRYAGFVGGYPQTLRVRPWQMQSALLAKGLFICGDSVYPGQGIPGVVLGGMIAAQRIKDYLR